MSAALISAVAGLVGAVAGTIVTIVTLRAQQRRATAEAARAEAEALRALVDVGAAEDETLATRWRALLEAQVEVVVQPMREELARLRGEVEAARRDAAAARTEVEAMRDEVTRHRARYWRTIEYIRVLLTLLTQHGPGVTVPSPPAEIADDI